MTRRTCHCGSTLCRQNRSGLCRRCSVVAIQTPELIARRVGKLRARLASEPELAARYRGQLAGTHSGALGEYRLRRLRAAKLPAWLPLEYRDLWRTLRAQRMTHDEVRAAIECQMAADAARYARTGALQQHQGARP